jgi:5-(carboxyamino)imidazole ribonucleotide synthase
MKNTEYFSSSFSLGIVGGGQLGKMLLQETRRLDITTRVLDPSAQAPCRIATNHFTQGSLTDYQSVKDFGQNCDVITIEIENVNTAALADLQKSGKKVYPQPAIIELIKSKIAQKKFYQKEEVPTAPFKTFVSKRELLAALENKSLSLPLVWKIDTGGFDGRGVSIVRKANQLNDLPDAPCLVENLIPFEKELAVVVARSASGQVKSYPVVEMDFHPTANLVEYVFSPSLLPLAKQQEARQLAENLVENLGLVGILAVEFFYTPQGQLLVNEVAPRVHNSGHLTIEGHLTSQFDQHLRAILGLPLGDTGSIQPAVMINLVGEQGHEGPVKYEGIKDIMALPGVYVHLYGKAQTRPFRKMGHVTILAPTLEEARAKAKKVKRQIKVIST